MENFTLSSDELILINEALSTRKMWVGDLVNCLDSKELRARYAEELVNIEKLRKYFYEGKRT